MSATIGELETVAVVQASKRWRWWRGVPRHGDISYKTLASGQGFTHLLPCPVQTNIESIQLLDHKYKTQMTLRICYRG